MKLPVQTRPVERRTYNGDAVTVGAKASFFGSILQSPTVQRTLTGALNGFLGS
ncbi:MAG: hypothetical protein R8G66_15920 [Cytophagales bacterium]|nr:hypothetical protein [Cytophagales bacterium]